MRMSMSFRDFGGVLFGLAIMVALVVLGGVLRDLTATALGQSIWWLLLGAALFLEWRDRHEWFLLVVCLGAAFCFATALLGVALNASMAIGSVNPESKVIQNLSIVGSLLTIAGYTCLFVGAASWNASHLGKGRQKTPER